MINSQKKLAFHTGDDLHRRLRMAANFVALGGWKCTCEVSHNVMVEAPSTSLVSDDLYCLPVTLPILYIPFHISSAVWVKSYNSCSPLVRSLSFVSCHRRWGGWWPDKKMDPWDIPILSFCRLRRSLNTTVLTNLRSDNKVAFKLLHEARDLIYFGQASGWRRPLKLSANYRGLWISGARVVRPPGCH